MILDIKKEEYQKKQFDGWILKIITGPLIVNEDGKYTLVGVVSWGYGCAMEGYPGVYARVTSVMPWIKEIVGSYL